MVDVSKQIKELNKQLYPTGRAWGYVHGSEQSETIVTRFVDGIGNPFVDGLGNAFIQTFGSEASPSKRLVNAFLKSHERYYVDLLSLLNELLADNDGFDAIDASNWERVFGLISTGLTLDERKANILRRQAYPSGVEERGNYLLIQDELQKAGFNVYLTENRFADGAGWEVQTPTLPFTLCANYIDESLDATYFDNIFSSSEMGIAESGVAEMEFLEQPPTDIQLRQTFFIGGSSFPSTVNVALVRKDEFRQLILKLKPAQTVAYLYVNYI